MEEKLRIAISKGHNVYNSGIFDNGASGSGFKEAIEVDKTVGILIVLLRNQGHTVVDVTPKNEHFKNSKQAHQERAKRVNAGGFDIYIDVHLNAGGGTGPEMWVYSPRGLSYDYARKIVTNMVEDTKLKNRGVKVKPTMWSLQMTNCPSIIVEGGFMDSKADMDIITPELYAKSIARAFGEVKEDKEIDKLYKIQVGAYSVKENADRLLKELENKGFKGFITEEKIQSKDVTEIKTEYYEKEGLKIIETDSDNIYVSILPGKTLRQLGVYGINGTWQNNVEAHLTRSVWGLVANSKGAIGPNSYQNSPNGHKRGTIICYQDGSIEVKRIHNINEITKPIKFAIGGGMLIPDYNPGVEKIASDILRHTHHTGIGYKGNRIYLIVTSNHCSLLEFKNKVDKLNLDGAIFLDGGGSTQMNYEGNKGIHSSRKLSHGIFIKGVK